MSRPDNMRKLGVKNIAEVYEAGFFLCLAGTVQHVSVVIHEYVNQWGGVSKASFPLIAFLV